MSKIRISTRDVFGNVRYIYNTPEGGWHAALANGIPYCFHQAAHAKDEMALKFELETAATAQQAVDILKRHATWDKAEFEIVSGPRDAFAQPLPLETMRLYRQLADGLSDMIEGGRLRESDVPDDYRWLAELLAKIAAADPGDANQIETIRREHEQDWRETMPDSVATAILTEGNA